MRNWFVEAATKVDRGLLLLLVLPWLLLLADDSWLFDYHGSIDAWFYFGFFLRLKQLLVVYGDTYYATRLPWILPGYLAFKVFPPLMAQYVLHIGFYYLAVVSVYWLLKRALSSRSALLAAVLMGCHSWFLWAIGSNYSNGTGTAYYCLTILTIVLAAQTAYWRLFLLLSGIFCGLTIFSNIFWIALTPSLLIYYAVVNRQHRKNSIVISAIWLVVGFAAVTAMLGAVNFLINGRLLFFLPSFNYASATNSARNPSQGDWQVLMPNASWLMYLVVTVISSAVLAVISQVRKLPLAMSPVGLGFQLCFWLNVLTFLGWELKGQPILQFFYYVGFLIPSAFIALGGQFAQLGATIDRLKPTQFWLAIAGTILITAIAYRLPMDVYALRHQAVVITLALSLPWVMLLGWALIVRSRVNQIASSAVLILLLTFNITNVACITSLSPLAYFINTNSFGGKPLLRNYVGSFAVPPGEVPPQNRVNSTQRHDAFLITVATQRYLRGIDPNVKLMFWYDFSESWLYRSIASAAIWTPLSERFPATSLETGATEEEIDRAKAFLAGRPDVVILSQKLDAFEQARRSLSQVGYNAELVSTRPMKQGEVSFDMTFIKVSKKR